MLKNARGIAFLKRPEGLAMAIYLLFTLTALVGYATFGLNPEWLAGRPGLTAFYAQSFTLFGQGHVLLGAGVLGIFLVRHAGPEWLPAFGVVYIVSFLSEFIGTGHGLPFGHYSYTALLGPQWFDRVPVLIPLSWFLMVLPAYVIVRRRLPARWGVGGRIMLAAVLFVIWDLSLDPAMSYLTSYWIWEQAGPYYGMPLINLGGWIATALVLMALMEMFAGRWVDTLSERWCMAYYGVTLLMPLGMVLAAGLWLPVVLTVGALALCAAFLSGGGPGAPGAEGERVRENNPSRLTSEEQQLFQMVQTQNAEAIFSHHARSFSFASWWFSPRERRLIACLYAFCRYTDDLVDGANGQARRDLEARLDAWRHLSHRAYGGDPSGIRWLDEIMAASARAGVPLRLIDELVDGVRMDIGRVDLQTFAELDAYSYRVASVVGIWKCYLAGATHPATLERAASMGRAMQLTNILRDVGEDLDSGRIYLPAELRSRYGITIGDLLTMRTSGEITPAYQRMIEALMVRAEAEYRRAFPGLIMLPRSYARASAVAAEVYRGIHRQIRRNRYDNLRQRAHTAPLQKVYLGMRGLWRLGVCRRNGGREQRGIAHDSLQPKWSVELGRWMQSWIVGLLLISCSVLATPAKGSASADETWTGQTAMEAVDSLHVRYAETVEKQRAWKLTVQQPGHSPDDVRYEGVDRFVLTHGEPSEAARNCLAEGRRLAQSVDVREA